MAKVNATGRSTHEGKHIRDYEWMLASPAYRSLSCVARCILQELKRLYNGSNNGDLFLGVRNAGERVHAHKDTAGRAFRELEERGFIRPRIKSGFNWKRGQATTWILAEFEFAGQLPTKDFMRWQPPAEIQNAVLNGGTECPKPRDSGPSEPDTSARECPKPRDTLTPKQGGHGPKRRDTVSQPSGGPRRASPRAKRSPVGVSVAKRAGAAGQPQTEPSSTPAASRDLSAKRPPARPTTKAKRPAVPAAPKRARGLNGAQPSSKHSSDSDASRRDDLPRVARIRKRSASKAPKKMGPAARAKNGGGRAGEARRR